MTQPITPDNCKICQEDPNLCSRIHHWPTDTNSGGLDEILESLVDYVESGNTTLGRPAALSPLEAKAAINQHMLDTFMELIGDYESVRKSMTLEQIHDVANRNSYRDELRKAVNERCQP